MTGLLVSVRSVDEAREALQGGADLVDLKEPMRGPLGAVEAEVMAQVLRLVAGRLPVSAALGELLDIDVAAPGVLPAGLAFAKLGMAGCAARARWPEAWARALHLLPRGTRPVAVVYADWPAALAPPPREVLQHARAVGCRGVLIDTFDKSAGSLLDHWTTAALADFLGEIRAAGLFSVLAGSLSCETIPRVLALAPRYIGVRGAACRGPRWSPIDGARVRRLARLVRGFEAQPVRPGNAPAG